MLARQDRRISRRSGESRCCCRRRVVDTLALALVDLPLLLDIDHLYARRQRLNGCSERARFGGCLLKCPLPLLEFEVGRAEIATGKHFVQRGVDRRVVVRW